jgi:hypothetical protein
MSRSFYGLVFGCGESLGKEIERNEGILNGGVFFFGLVRM